MQLKKKDRWLGRRTSAVDFVWINRKTSINPEDLLNYINNRRNLIKFNKISFNMKIQLKSCTHTHIVVLYRSHYSMVNVLDSLDNANVNETYTHLIFGLRSFALFFLFIFFQFLPLLFLYAVFISLFFLFLFRHRIRRTLKCMSFATVTGCGLNFYSHIIYLLFHQQI